MNDDEFQRSQDDFIAFSWLNNFVMFWMIVLI